MLTSAEIAAYAKLLVLCPHCGGNGQLVMNTACDITTVQTQCKGCGHVSAEYYPSKETVLRLVKEWAEGSPRHTIQIPAGAPIIANYGAGVDSTCMLIKMYEAGIRPDLILFSIVDEKPETFAYVDYFDAWLRSVGFPGITRVAYRPVSAPYTTLEGNVLANETLPSISFRMKGCSLKWKAQVMDNFILGVSRGPNKCEGWAPALEALASGVKPVKLIGYDFGNIDSCRAINMTEDSNFRYLYPLRDLKLNREDCIATIKRAGLKVPIKSACYYCASSKPWELMWMAAEHPDLLERALIIEDTARNGKHGLHGVTGLWGQDSKKLPGSWRQWCEDQGIIEPGTYNVVADQEWLLAEARKSKPELEINLDFELPLTPMDEEEYRLAA
jgi:hypothetical protein